MKNLFFKILLTLLVFAMPIQVLGDNKLSSESAVERSKDLEKKYADKIKSLKKEYDAKVTIEKWKDGMCYYIINKKKTFARADMAGNLISFIDEEGNKVSFFKECKLVLLSNGECLTNLLPPPPAKKWVFAWTSGKIYNGGGKSRTIKNGDKYLVKIERGTGTNTTSELYALDGRRIIGRSFKTIKSYSPTKNFVDSYGMKCKVAGGFDYLLCTGGPIGYDNAMVVGDVSIDIPNHFLPGGTLYLNDKETKTSSQSKTIQHFTSEGECIQSDSTLTIIFNKPSSVYHWFTDEKIADSVVCVKHISGTEYAIYECGSSPSPCNRMGFVQLSILGGFSPCIFTDIYVTDYGKVMVKVNADEDFQPYDKKANYIPDTINSFDQLVQMVHNKETLSGKQQNILSSYVLQSLSHDLMTQSQIEAMVENDKNYSNLYVPSSHMKFEVNRTMIKFDFDKTGELYHPLLDQCTQSKKILAQKMYIEICDNFYQLTIKHTELYLRKQDEKSRRIKEEAARQKQMKERREKIAKLNKFIQQINEAQAIVNGSSTRSTSSNSKGTIKAVTGRNANSSTQQKVSSTKQDNAGRKGWLRGEIATWRNKLKKAQQSYNQAMSSGEDTPQKKRVLDSKQKTIDTCLEMIHQYEAELNSLK